MRSRSRCCAYRGKKSLDHQCIVRQFCRRTFEREREVLRKEIPPSKKERVSPPPPSSPVCARSCKSTHRDDALLFRRGHLHLCDVLGRGGRGLEPLLFAIVGGACEWNGMKLLHQEPSDRFTLRYAVVAAQEPTVAHDVPAGAEGRFHKTKKEATIMEHLAENFLHLIFTAKKRRRVF